MTRFWWRNQLISNDIETTPHRFVSARLCRP